MVKTMTYEKDKIDPNKVSYLSHFDTLYVNNENIEGSCVIIHDDIGYKLSIFSMDFKDLLYKVRDIRPHFKLFTQGCCSYVDVSLFETPSMKGNYIKDGSIGPSFLMHHNHTDETFNERIKINLSRHDCKKYDKMKKEVEWRNQNKISLEHPLTEDEQILKKLHLGF